MVVLVPLLYDPPHISHAVIMYMYTRTHADTHSHDCLFTAEVTNGFHFRDLLPFIPDEIVAT